MFNIRNDTLGLSPFGGYNVPQKGFWNAVAAGIGAAGSIYNNILGNKAAQGMSSAQMSHEENMYALQYRHAMEAELRADKRWYEQMDYQQELERAMLDYTFKNYNSPEAQAKFLRAAGLNPSAMLANGSSPFGNMPTPSAGGVGMMQGNTPSANSGFTPFHQGFENPFAHVGETIKQIAEAQKAMSESEYTDVNTEFALQTFGARAGQELVKLGSMQLEQDRQQWLFSLDKENLPKKQKWEIKRLINESFKLQSEGHYYQAMQGVQDVTERLLNMDLAIKAPYAANAVTFGKTALADMRAEIEEKRAKAQEARYSGENLRNEAWMRGFNNRLIELQSRIYGMDNSNFHAVKASVTEDVRGMLQMARDKNIISQEAAEQANARINRAMKYNSLPEWMRDTKSLIEWLAETGGSFAGAAANVYGANKISKGMQRKPQEHIHRYLQFVPVASSAYLY